MRGIVAALAALTEKSGAAVAKTESDKGVTLIAKNARLEGEITFDNELYVYGQVNGNIRAGGDKATLVIGDQGRVKGDVRAPVVVINGEFEGTVFASSKVVLAEKARVSGNLCYKRIEMRIGARMDGQLAQQEKAGAEVHAFPSADRQDG
ncbi:MAG: polymer-forming cytoskeletal protein [Gammaproteobacteria bacterium]|nr:polymer-forming cytoskeletal protein [Gammaproteobacteria bacterium]MDE0273255.1 polymer-forming cytoskeletal protein [Gammaproteobacteria bacterium]